MKKSITLKVADPCKECWSNMKSNDLGKFCQICETDVFDFSDLTDDEVVEILRHAPQKVCGKFRLSQLNHHLLLNDKKVRSTNPRFPTMLAATMMLAVASPMLQAQDINPTIDKIESPIFLVEKFNSLNSDTIAKLNPVIIGHVYSREDKGEVTGATILLEGKDKIGVISGLNGEFKLSIPQSYAEKRFVTLDVRIVGFKNKRIEVDLNKNEPLKIYLEEETMLLGEVIIIRNDFYDPIYGW